MVVVVMGRGRDGGSKVPVAGGWIGRRQDKGQEN